MLEVDPIRFIYTFGFYRWTAAWKHVKSIHKIEHGIAIEVTWGRAIYVPLTIFKDSEEADLFVEQAREYLQSIKNGIQIDK